MNNTNNITQYYKTGCIIKKNREKEFSGYGGQNKFAKKYGFDKQLVSAWESGRRNPSHENAVKLAKVFGISVAELRGESIKSTSQIRTPGKLPGLNDQLVRSLHGAALIRRNLDEAQSQVLQGELSADDFEDIVASLLKGLESALVERRNNRHNSLNSTKLDSGA